jgi:hypothetical protein
MSSSVEPRLSILRLERISMDSDLSWTAQSISRPEGNGELSGVMVESILLAIASDEKSNLI